MAKLEDLNKGVLVKGILSDVSVVIVDVKWHGSDVIEVYYKDNTSGKPGSELIYRDSESSIEILEKGLPWSFDGDSSLFKLVSESYRIKLAHLFDPYIAIHTSLVEPLPHQITAVYGEMLPRQPLRFLIADDPGSGKTIMTGLFIKELIIRGDINRCLIVTPGNLTEQWQDELSKRFNLPFEILTNDRIEASRTGNIFNEIPLCLARLDKLSRDKDKGKELQDKLRASDWDLIVCDEAHKMSASFFGGEIKYTKRHNLGQLLSGITRHFLLLTATPHNGKEEDFQLFMSLLDGDRFEGKFRDGVHQVDTTDLMRRLIKEELLKFDGTPLFPERLASTVNYKLSDGEAYLYKEVTEYVRNEFNRADKLDKDRRGTVGFALTILQRRLASSPEAIYQSLRRRKERLEKRLREEKLLKRGAGVIDTLILTEDDVDDIEDMPDEELEKKEEELVDLATTARTIAELEIEIQELKRLEDIAKEVLRSERDRKWEELSGILQDKDMFDKDGERFKLVIFTEHRDTLKYLISRIRTLIGRDEAVVSIYGGMGREERRKIQEAFTQDREVQILVATDAAGEGINLQRAHLMVNYDLPWNPNRLEQRFGRIHRIGQTEVCHLWNLVAAETREGDVFNRLFKKLEEERNALGGRVFDVLGKIIFDERPLRDLLIEAIRYGEQPEVREKLYKVVDKALDRNYLQQLLEEKSLASDCMDKSKVMAIRQEMERIQARRLQPHFILTFFLEAFRTLGGTIKEREAKRYEITHVPAVIRNRDRMIGTGEAVLTRYERITFEKDLVNLQGKTLATLICPGHPLLDSTIDLLIERYRELLKRGTVLIDPSDSTDVRILFYIEHSIQDGKTDKAGNRRLVSRQIDFVEINKNGIASSAGYAPYLNYRPPDDHEVKYIGDILKEDWLKGDLEGKATSYAIESLVPLHFKDVKKKKEDIIDRTIRAVKERLTKEINYWDHRAEELKLQEATGKVNARINSQKARQRADELERRLMKRQEDLQQERKLSPLPPVIIGGALIVPKGILRKDSEPALFAINTKEIEEIAMRAVMKKEMELGFIPRDVSKDKCGYDIESSIPGSGKLRFIEVKGRVKDAKTVTITKNEILTALNKPEDYFLTIVEVEDGRGIPVYIKPPFKQEPDFGVTSINYNIAELMKFKINYQD
ncbi:MAG: helicase-related protein [Candidatus Eremiobacterota bacterium]